MIESNVIEQRLARNGTELWRKVDKIGFASQHVRVFIILIKSVNKRNRLGCGQLHVRHLTIFDVITSFHI